MGRCGAWGSVPAPALPLHSDSPPALHPYFVTSGDLPRKQPVTRRCWGLPCPVFPGPSLPHCPPGPQLHVNRRSEDTGPCPAPTGHLAPFSPRPTVLPFVLLCPPGFHMTSCLPGHLDWPPSAPLVLVPASALRPTVSSCCGPSCPREGEEHLGLMLPPGRVSRWCSPPTRASALGAHVCLPVDSHLCRWGRDWPPQCLGLAVGRGMGQEEGSSLCHSGIKFNFIFVHVLPGKAFADQQGACSSPCQGGDFLKLWVLRGTFFNTWGRNPALTSPSPPRHSCPGSP